MYKIHRPHGISSKSDIFKILPKNIAVSQENNVFPMKGKIGTKKIIGMDIIALQKKIAYFYRFNIFIEKFKFPLLASFLNVFTSYFKIFSFVYDKCYKNCK